MLFFRYPSLTIQVLLAVLSASGVKTQCVEKTEAAGKIGDIVPFYVCLPPDGDEIGVVEGDDQFILLENTWQQGWFWEEMSDDTSSYFHILHDITSESDFGTTDISLPTKDISINKLYQFTTYEAGVESQSTCVEKTEAGGPVDGTAHFYVCLPPNDDVIGVGLGIYQFSVYKNTWQYGWSWEELSDSTSSYFHILRNITLDDVMNSLYTTIVVLPVKDEDIAISHELTFYIEGPPVPCRDSGYVPLVTAFSFGSSANSTTCVISQSEPHINYVSHIPPDCMMETTESSTFNVKAVQDSEHLVVYMLVFEVTRLSRADVGSWTINVTNNDGTMMMDVYVYGSPLLCDASQQTLETDYCIDNVAYVLIYGSGFFELETTRTSNTSASNNCSEPLEVAVSRQGPEWEVNELMLNVTCNDVSNWTVTIIDYSSTLEIDVTIGECAVNAFDESGDDSFKWLALGLGLVMLVVIIVFAFVVVTLMRKIKRLSLTKTMNVTLIGDSRENEDLSARAVYSNPTWSGQQTSNYETINDVGAVEQTQNVSAPVVATPVAGVYTVPNDRDLTPLAISDHVDAAPGGYVTMDSELTDSSTSDYNLPTSELTDSNRSDHIAPTTSRYETVSADFPFSRAARTTSGGTSDRGQLGMISGPYDTCGSENIEPPNVYERVNNGSYVNHGIGREDEGASETSNNVGSAYANAN